MTFAPLLEISKSITPREADVAVALAQGLGYKEAAAVLKMAESTVRRHAEKLADKFDGHITPKLRAAGPKFLIVAWMHQLRGLGAALTAEQLISKCEEAKGRLAQALSAFDKQNRPTRKRREA